MHDLKTLERLNADVTTAADTVTTTVFAASLTGRMIAQAFGCPPDARVYLSIPGGGDWANTDLDISDTDPVTITWTEIKQTSGRS